MAYVIPLKNQKDLNVVGGTLGWDCFHDFFSSTGAWPTTGGMYQRGGDNRRRSFDEMMQEEEDLLKIFYELDDNLTMSDYLDMLPESQSEKILFGSEVSNKIKAEVAPTVSSLKNLSDNMKSAWEPEQGGGSKKKKGQAQGNTVGKSAKKAASNKRKAQGNTVGKSAKKAATNKRKAPRRIKKKVDITLDPQTLFWEPYIQKWEDSVTEYLKNDKNKALNNIYKTLWTPDSKTSKPLLLFHEFFVAFPFDTRGEIAKKSDKAGEAKNLFNRMDQNSLGRLWKVWGKYCPKGNLKAFVGHWKAPRPQTPTTISTFASWEAGQKKKEKLSAEQKKLIGEFNDVIMKWWYDNCNLKDIQGNIKLAFELMNRYPGKTTEAMSDSKLTKFYKDYLYHSNIPRYTAKNIEKMKDPGGILDGFPKIARANAVNGGGIFSNAAICTHYDGTDPNEKVEKKRKKNQSAIKKSNTNPGEKYPDILPKTTEDAKLWDCFLSSKCDPMPACSDPITQDDKDIDIKLTCQTQSNPPKGVKSISLKLTKENLEKVKIDFEISFHGHTEDLTSTTKLRGDVVNVGKGLSKAKVLEEVCDILQKNGGIKGVIHNKGILRQCIKRFTPKMTGDFSQELESIQQIMKGKDTIFVANDQPSMFRWGYILINIIPKPEQNKIGRFWGGYLPAETDSAFLLTNDCNVNLEPGGPAVSSLVISDDIPPAKKRKAALPKKKKNKSKRKTIRKNKGKIKRKTKRKTK